MWGPWDFCLGGIVLLQKLLTGSGCFLVTQPLSLSMPRAATWLETSQVLLGVGTGSQARLRQRLDRFRHEQAEQYLLPLLCFSAVSAGRDCNLGGEKKENKNLFYACYRTLI